MYEWKKLAELEVFGVRIFGRGVKRGYGRPMAEIVGFEPTEPISPTVFKTVSLNHSDISPCWCH